jgi:ABC-type sulfate transport system permease subunit
MSILIVELIFLAILYEDKDYEVKAFFLLLTLITGFAMKVFIVEGLLQRRRTKQRLQNKQAHH